MEKLHVFCSIELHETDHYSWQNTAPTNALRTNEVTKSYISQKNDNDFTKFENASMQTCWNLDFSNRGCYGKIIKIDQSIKRKDKK